MIRSYTPMPTISPPPSFHAHHDAFNPRPANLYLLVYVSEQIVDVTSQGLVLWTILRVPGR